MSGSLFQITKSKGIYHTTSLWGMLSPRLSKNQSQLQSHPDIQKNKNEPKPWEKQAKNGGGGTNACHH